MANDLNPAALRPLYDACKAQHGAIDTLLAMLIERDKSFMPSKSTVWPVVVQANEALSKAVEQALAASLPATLPVDAAKPILSVDAEEEAAIVSRAMLRLNDLPISGDPQTREAIQESRRLIFRLVVLEAISALGGGVPTDVRELVIAARVVSLEDQSPEALKRLDEAAEAFAERVPWEDDPNVDPMVDIETERLAEAGRDIADALAPGQPRGEPELLTSDERAALELLLDLAGAAWSLADNTCDNRLPDGSTFDAPDGVVSIEPKDFDELAGVLDKMDELPDDQPGYTMDAAAKVDWALRRLRPDVHATHSEPRKEAL